MLKTIQKLISGTLDPGSGSMTGSPLPASQQEASQAILERVVINLPYTYESNECSIALDRFVWDRICQGESLRLKGERTRLIEGDPCWLWWEVHGGQQCRLSCEAHRDDGSVFSIYKGPLVPSLIEEICSRSPA